MCGGQPQDQARAARVEAETSAAEQISDYAQFAQEATAYAELAERRAASAESRAKKLEATSLAVGGGAGFAEGGGKEEAAADWVRAYDEEGDPYYFHRTTMETSWVQPEGVTVVEADDDPEILRDQVTQATEYQARLEVMAAEAGMEAEDARQEADAARQQAEVQVAEARAEARAVGAAAEARQQAAQEAADRRAAEYGAEVERTAREEQDLAIQAFVLEREMAREEAAAESRAAAAEAAADASEAVRKEMQKRLDLEEERAERAEAAAILAQHETKEAEADVDAERMLVEAAAAEQARLEEQMAAGMQVLSVAAFRCPFTAFRYPFTAFLCPFAALHRGPTAGEHQALEPAPVRLRHPRGEPIEAPPSLFAPPFPATS